MTMTKAATQPLPVLAQPARKPRLSVDDYVAGVRRADRAILARAITLLESTTPAHEEQAQEMLHRLLPFTGKAKRIGITGVPGAGKSTFIESLGCYLCQQGHRVAVLAIDPSSSRSRGSILGDKTRMEKLAGEPNAFIRPSPSGGTLGGVARKTREARMLCDAAGFDVVITETVGVGQSEVVLRSMVDFFLLLLVAGTGDDLQGIKRGIMEMADHVLINKADGDNRIRAEAARGEQAMALHYMAPATPPWRPEVGLCSGLTGVGIPEFWQTVERFYTELEVAGVIAARRRRNRLQWMEELVNDELLRRFRRHHAQRTLRPQIEKALLAGEITAVRAAHQLLDAFDHRPGIRPVAPPSSPEAVPPGQA